MFLSIHLNCHFSITRVNWLQRCWKPFVVQSTWLVFQNSIMEIVIHEIMIHKKVCLCIILCTACTNIFVSFMATEVCVWRIIYAPAALPVNWLQSSLLLPLTLRVWFSKAVIPSSTCIPQTQVQLLSWHTSLLGHKLTWWYTRYNTWEPIRITHRWTSNVFQPIWTGAIFLASQKAQWIYWGNLLCFLK